MKETQFINQNKDKWRKFENAYKANSHNPDELSHLFVEITGAIGRSKAGRFRKQAFGNGTVGAGPIIGSKEHG